MWWNFDGIYFYYIDETQSVYLCTWNLITGMLSLKIADSYFFVSETAKKDIIA